MKKVAALALLLSVLASSLFISDAEARPYYKKRVNQRQCRQTSRIYNGRTNGSLTASETAKLRHQQHVTAQREAAFRASGGGLSRSEAARLEARQDAYSNNIYRQKHDNQSRPQ